MPDLKGMRVVAFVGHLVAHCQEQFPIDCPKCRTRYASFQAYVQQTEPIGLQLFDSAKLLEDAIGTLSLANCACGTTLSLECSETGGETYKTFLDAIENDAKDGGVSTIEVLNRLRDTVRRTVLESATETRSRIG